MLIAETEYRSEVELVIAPLRGLALGVFLITVGMQIDLGALIADWPQLLAALAGVLLVKAIVTGALLRLVGVAHRGRRRNRAADGQPVGNDADPARRRGRGRGHRCRCGRLLAGGDRARADRDAAARQPWPLHGAAGRRADARGRFRRRPSAGRTVIFGFGRVGQMVADMLGAHGQPYLAVDSDIDSVLDAREAGYSSALFGDVARRELIEKLDLDQAAAVVLTMDDPVLTARITRQLRARITRSCRSSPAPATPTMPRRFIAPGSRDAVPEALEASLQLSRGGAGRHWRGDGPGDRVDPRETRRAARRDHGRGRARSRAGLLGGRAISQKGAREQWAAPRLEPRWMTFSIA